MLFRWYYGKKHDDSYVTRMVVHGCHASPHAAIRLAPESRANSGHNLTDALP